MLYLDYHVKGNVGFPIVTTYHPGPDMLERQLIRLRDDYPALPAPLTLRLHPGDGDPALGSELERLAARVVDLTAGAIVVAEGDGKGPAVGPALTVSSGGCGRIHYQTVPDGLEAEPFVDLLLALGRGAGGGAILADLVDPAEILVFVSGACPHCARSVRSAHDAALASPLVTVNVVDAMRFPDLADRYGVRSVPVTLLDRGEGIPGAVTIRDLADRLLTRGTPGREAAVFASLIETGRFPEATERVVHGNGARSFASVWIGGTLALRLGLMVVAEMILEEDAEALDGIVETILPVLDDEEPGPRGDTADLLGKIAHPGAAGALRALAADPHPDVAEAVADALAAIAARGERNG